MKVLQLNLVWKKFHYKNIKKSTVQGFYLEVNNNVICTEILPYSQKPVFTEAKPKT